MDGVNHKQQGIETQIPKHCLYLFGFFSSQLPCTIMTFSGYTDISEDLASFWFSREIFPNTSVFAGMQVSHVLNSAS